MRKARAKNPESGYALLLIFAMAAIVAIMLYREVPRVAFEAQRDKEQLLVDRGQEYQRAIALFVRKNQRFPASIDELEKSNNQRYLRRRFPDPMTGKADWRILHAGPNGIILDSVTQGSKKTTDDISTPSNFTTLEMANLSTPGGGGDAGVNLATRKRPSESGGDSLNSSFGNMPMNDPAPAQSANPASPNNGNTGYNGPVMVLPDGRVVPANASGTAPPVGANGATGSSPLPGMPGMPGGFPGAPGGPPLPTGVAIQQNTQGFQPMPMPPGGIPNGPPNSAAGLINQILTTPRPGGINGLPGGQGVTPQGQPSTGAFGTPQTNAPQQNIVGGGLAGVASKREQEGIKTINDLTKYNEWEFVYDISKDPTRQRGAVGGTGPQGRGPTGPQQRPPNPLNPGPGR